MFETYIYIICKTLSHYENLWVLKYLLLKLFPDTISNVQETARVSFIERISKGEDQPVGFQCPVENKVNANMYTINLFAYS